MYPALTRLFAPCKIPKTKLSAALAALAMTSVHYGWAQTFPDKPIRIVASAPGGGGDFMARLIAQETTAGFGRPVVVENRTALLANQIVSRATPDGYTLVVAGSSFMIGHLLNKVDYDPVRDFSPVVLVSTSPNIVAVHASVPVQSVKELIALAQAKPGVLNYGAGATGGTQHLSGELFNYMAGIKIVAVHYKGSGPAVNALIGNEVQMMISNAASFTVHIQSGRLRALAVTSSKPSALAPGLPTVAASGVPGYESVGIDALFAPAKTPVAVIRRLNQEVVRAIQRPDVRQKFLDSGVEVVGSSPAELGSKLKSEINKWTEVIKRAGISQQ